MASYLRDTFFPWLYTCSKCAEIMPELGQNTDNRRCPDCNKPGHMRCLRIGGVPDRQHGCHPTADAIISKLLRATDLVIVDELERRGYWRLDHHYCGWAVGASVFCMGVTARRAFLFAFWRAAKPK